MSPCPPPKQGPQCCRFLHDGVLHFESQITSVYDFNEVKIPFIRKCLYLPVNMVNYDKILLKLRTTIVFPSGFQWQSVSNQESGFFALLAKIRITWFQYQHVSICVTLSNTKPDNARWFCLCMCSTQTYYVLKQVGEAMCFASIIYLFILFHILLRIDFLNSIILPVTNLFL